MIEEPMPKIYSDDITYFRRLLSTTQKVFQESRSSMFSTSCVRWTKTVHIFLVFLSLGMAASMYSATLLELQHKTSVTLDAAALFITIFNFGRLAGSLLATWLYKKMSAELSMTVALAGSAIMLILVPWCPVYAAMAAVIFAHGIHFAYVTVGVNSQCFPLWGSRSRPVIQAVHFFFSCGSAIAPLVANPFLSLANNSSITQQTSDTLMRPVDSPQVDVSHSIYDIQYNIVEDGAHLNSDLTSSGRKAASNLSTSKNITYIFATINSSNNTANITLPSTGESVNWAFSIVGSFQLLICASILSTIMMTLSSTRSATSNHHPSSSAQRQSGLNLLYNQNGVNKLLPSPPSVKTPTVWSQCRPLIAMLVAFYFAHANVETTSSSLFLPFAVSHLAMSKSAGNHVAFAFWAAVSGGRALAIFVSKIVKPATLLTANVTLICTSLVMLMSFGRTHYIVVWLCVVGLGLGISSVFAGLLNVTYDYVKGYGESRVPPALVAIYMASSAIGSMVGPAAGGWLFSRVGTWWLLYYLLLWAVISACLLVAIRVYHSRVLLVRDTHPETNVINDSRRREEQV